MHDRRRFLTRFAGGTAAAALTPRVLLGADDGRIVPAPVSRDPDESYWRLVKDGFPLADGLVLMNAANLCPAPYEVQNRLFELTRDVDADASFQNRAKFAEMREHARQVLATHLGADADEIAIIRNTSEGNNTVVNGLELGPGDEVVLWDQNHPTNSLSWDERAKRRGFAVRRVATPPTPTSADELMEVFSDALGPRTRVLAFSHVSNATGVALPAAALCAVARELDVLTLVDGAQSCGALALDLHAMGCDFFTASSHKWLTGPKEAGLLYVRADLVDDLWAADVGVGWQAAVEGGARKFENLGQRDDACVATLGTAAEFHSRIGAEVIESRLHALTAALKAGLADRIPGVSFATPQDDALSAGVVVFQAPGIAAREGFQRLYAEHRIACAAMGDGIRLSPHLYNTMEEVGQVVDAVVGLTA